MTSIKPRTRVALGACIAAFCIAMGLREIVNIWVGTGAAALISLTVVASIPERPSMVGEGGAVRGIAWGVLVGVLMSIATWVLYPISVELIPAIGVEVERLYALLRQPPGPVMALPVLVFVVAAEEIVWRGLAIDMFAAKGGEGRALFFASVTYVFPQVAFRSLLMVVVALLCGIVWGVLRLRTKGLIAPFVAHLVWDLLVFVLFPVA